MKYVEDFGTDYMSAYWRAMKLARQGYQAEHFPCFPSGDEKHWRVVWGDYSLREPVGY